MQGLFVFLHSCFEGNNIYFMRKRNLEFYPYLDYDYNRLLFSIYDKLFNLNNLETDNL